MLHFAKVDFSGNLKMPYEKIYGLEHFAILVLSRIKKNVTEWNVVLFLWFIEIILALIVVFV